jgi:hypothetical protein
MERQTRANLIFLAILIALSVPPAIILFRKKLDPAARPMYLPDPVHTTLPYMTPGDTPPGVARIVGPLTGRWRRALAGDQSPATGPANAQPVVSADRLLELLSAVRESDSLRIRLVLWDERFGEDPARYRLDLINNPPATGAILLIRTVALPDDVRRELQNGGFVRPPRHVRLLDAALPPSSAGRILTIEHRADPPVTDSVVLRP